jgi:hypothetical protein
MFTSVKTSSRFWGPCKSPLNDTQGFLPGLKRPKREVNSSFQSNDEVKNKLNYNSPPHTGWFITPSGISDVCDTAAGMVTTGGGGMSTEGQTLQVSLVLCGTRSETSVAPSQLTQFWQIPRHGTLPYPLSTPFRHDWPLAVKPASPQRRLLPKKKLGEILYRLICSFLLCLSWLFCCRVQKFWRKLLITLYMPSCCAKEQLYIFIHLRTRKEIF